MKTVSANGHTVNIQQGTHFGHTTYTAFCSCMWIAHDHRLGYASSASDGYAHLISICPNTTSAGLKERVDFRIRAALFYIVSEYGSELVLQNLISHFIIDEDFSRG